MLSHTADAVATAPPVTGRSLHMAGTARRELCGRIEAQAGPQPSGASPEPFRAW